MKKLIASIIFLLILYVSIYVFALIMQFTFQHMNLFISIAFNLTAIILLVYIINKIVVKLDKRE
jgi:hypothetical protein